MNHSPRRLRGLKLVAAVAVSAIAVGAALSGCSSAGSPGATTIRLSMQQQNLAKNDPATFKVVQAFEKKYPKIKVKLEGQSSVPAHIQAMTVAAQGNTLPDIFWIYASNAQQMYKAGKVMDLSSVVTDTNLTGNFRDSVLGAYKDGSAQYGLPYQALITGFYFNKEIFGKYGVTPPETSDDLLNVCKKLSDAGVVPIAKGANQSAFSVWAFLTMLDRFGYESKYKQILAGKASYDNPDFLKLYEYIAQMKSAGCFPSNVTTQSYVQAVDSFTQAKAAMLDSGIWQATQIDASLKGKVGFWAGPTFADGVGNQKLAMNVPSAPFAVAASVKKDSTKLDAVKKFLAFYYSDQGQQILVDNGQPPVTKYSPKVDASQQPTFAAALAESTKPGWSSPQAQPDLVVPTAVANAMYDSIYGVIEGSTTPKAAVQAVQQAFAAK